MSNFQPLEVVGRDSETQLQVGENFEYSILRFKDYFRHLVGPVAHGSVEFVCLTVF